MRRVSKTTFCNEPDCNESHYGKGYCWAHYTIWYRRSDKGSCKVDDCVRSAATRGWCNSHYLSWKRHGDPLVAKSRFRTDGKSICADNHCNVLATRIGNYCSRHYENNRRQNDPLNRVANNCMRRRMRLREAFVQDIDRWLVYDVFNGHCYLCGYEIDPDSEWDIEHIQPVSKDGLHAYHNVAPSHDKCNSSKHDKTLMEFMIYKGVDYEPISI